MARKKTQPKDLPELLTVKEVAEWLRTSEKAVYAMVSRQHIPGVVRVGSRVLFDRGELSSWIDGYRAPYQPPDFDRPGLSTNQ